MSNGARRPARRRIGWILALLFLVVPLLELYVLIQVGQVIGVWWTILLLVADSIFGAWLMRREGSRAWKALQEAITGGRMPSKELADGALVVLGGALMLSPGFVTDVFGIVLILPFTRPFFRGILASAVQRRMLTVTTTYGQTYGQGHRPDDGVVSGEVIDEE